MGRISHDTSERPASLEGTLAAPSFDLEASMDCGQIFGWHKHGGSYLGIIGGVAVSLRQGGGVVQFVAGRRMRSDLIRSYLGLDEDLEAIHAEIARDDFMRKAINSAPGLRILRQDAWPCLCSYILSANNRVERIDQLVKEISRRFGRRQEAGGREVYSLPGVADLADCPESGVRACGVGFRAPYLVGAARMIAGGEISVERVRDAGYEEARELLKKLPGVGNKIADCVLLFAFSRYEAFPVDVWIKRAMETVYFDSRDVKPEEIRLFGQDYFGRYAGYAQEYIYYYTRNHGFPGFS
jgi:N-glycosylase/DNA lyase